MSDLEKSLVKGGSKYGLSDSELEKLRLVEEQSSTWRFAKISAILMTKRIPIVGDLLMAFLSDQNDMQILGMKKDITSLRDRLDRWDWEKRNLFSVLFQAGLLLEDNPERSIDDFNRTYAITIGI